MLKSDKERLDYSNILMPPVEYEVVQAIGTTYSLDLETLLGIPLALSLSQSMDGAVRENGLHILEGIRRTSSKMAVFCQRGKISVPHEKREVLSLMENSIFQVLPKGDYSFHPKVWVLKYESKKEAGKYLYKVIVLSRNLIFDRSWDIAVAIDGELTDEEHKENKPIQDFLNYVAGFATSSQKKKEIKALAKEILQVEFRIDRKDFNEFSFHPLGIPGYMKDNSGLLEETFHNMFIISPFLSKSTVSLLEAKRLTNSELILVSRKAELHKLERELASKIDCWHMKDCVIEGESLLEEQGDTSKQDIHAKVQRLTEAMVFTELKITQLGMFYGVRYMVKDEVIKEVVIKINTECIPESRDSEIFKNIIKNKENFIQYIAFLLGEDYLLAALESGADKKGEAFKYAGHNFEKPILYEKMLKASSRYPERLDEIKKLMEFIGKYNSEVVPEEFKKLYEVFDKNVNVLILQPDFIIQEVKERRCKEQKH